MCGAGRPPADGSAEIDGATAALVRKDGSGIYFPPNPLAGITSICIKAGVGTNADGSGYCEWGDSRLLARSKSMARSRLRF